jgi:hypothetical protein
MHEITSEKIKEHCNKCLSWNNHSTVHTERIDWSDEIADGIEIYGSDIWQLLRCLGCDTVKLKHTYWFSEETDGYGNQVTNTEYFPPSITRQKPKWRSNLFPYNSNLHSYNALCDEIYGALALGAHRLATMGIRALVERLMIDQVEDQGRFEKNISAFFLAGHVAVNQQDMFKDTLIEAGHAAMHRAFEPSADTVNTLLDIVEGIMHSIYHAPMIAEQVKKTIPSRKLGRENLGL